MSKPIKCSIGEMDGAFTVVYTWGDGFGEDVIHKDTVHLIVNRIFGGIDVSQEGWGDHVRIPHEAIPALRRLLDDYDKYARTREVNGE